jgi:hypothetical protein
MEKDIAYTDEPPTRLIGIIAQIPSANNQVTIIEIRFKAEDYIHSPNRTWDFGAIKKCKVKSHLVYEGVTPVKIPRAGSAPK